MEKNTVNKIYWTLGILFFLILMLAMLTRKSTFEHSRDLSDIVADGKILVISENSSTGFNIDSDNISGFQYEILKKFAERLNIEIEIVLENDLKKCIRELQKGQFDILAKYIPTTTEWQDEIVFSDPLLISRLMLVQRVTDSDDQLPVTHIKQLANDTIWIAQHSPHKMRLIHLAEELATTIHIEELKGQTTEQLVALVSEGKIKNSICYEQLSRKLTKDYPNIDTSLPVSLSQPYSWALNKNAPELLNELNQFLSEYIGSLEYWDLYQRYY